MEWKYDRMEERYDPMEHGYDPMECKSRLDCIFVQNAPPYIVAMFFEIGPIGRFFGTDCLHFKNVSFVHFLF